VGLDAGRGGGHAKKYTLDVQNSSGGVGSRQSA
jgi:hypothetical protein